MSSYLIAKSIHVTAVSLTLLSFTVRGVWMATNSPLLTRRWVRVAPHVIDTILLLSGAYLAFVFYRYPLVFNPWITAKLIGLVVYVLLGTVALKRGRTKRIRVIAFFGALLVFAYIVHTAVTKSVLPV